MANTNINLMILGQTGSGKSTLINYLHGSKEVEEGAGPPVTNRGEFAKISIPSPLKPDVSITILDSWGLESNKAEDWKKLISERLVATLSYTEMVYGIVYCLSYSQDRIQDFEITMLKELLNKGYKIVIVMTNADNGGFETKKVAFREKLNRELPEYRHYYDVVDVCAKSIKKIGATTATQTFGKDELLEQIEKDMSVNFTKVFMANIREWREQSLKKIGEFSGEHRNTIDSGSNANLKDRAKLIQSEIKHLAKDIFDRINTAMEEAKSFYSKIGGAFSRVYYPDWELADIVVGIGFLLERFGETLKNIFTGGGVVKEQLNKRLDEAVESLKAEVEKRFKEADEFGEKIRRQQA